jgi:hypothetical protein
VVGSRLTAYDPFGSLRAVSVSCRYSLIRICVAEVEAASCWGLSTKPPMGYGHPECRSPTGRMYDGGVYAALCPGGVIEPPVTADCFGRKTSWGCQPARVIPQPSGIMFPPPTDVYHMISNEAVKTIVFAVCCLSLRPQSDPRFCQKHPVNIPARYETKQIRYLLLLNMICDIPLDHERIHPRKTNRGRGQCTFASAMLSRKSRFAQRLAKEFQHRPASSAILVAFRNAGSACPPFGTWSKVLKAF